MSKAIMNSMEEAQHPKKQHRKGSAAGGINVPRKAPPTFSLKAL
jgi:hypothetical protein